MDELSPLFQEIEFHERYRGYDPDEVDAFVDRVARAAAVMRGRIAELHERAEAAETRGAMVGHHSDAEETLTRTLVLAQRTADAAIAEAREEADRLTADAATSAQAILSAAEAEAQLTLKESQSEAAAALEEARERAGLVMAEAETDRRAMVAEAESIAAEAANVERERLAAEVAELHEYRAFLADDIEILERHLAEERLQLTASVSALTDLLESPEAFRVSRPPATSGLEIDDETIESIAGAAPVVEFEPLGAEPVAEAMEDLVDDETAVDEPAVEEIAVEEPAVEEIAVEEIAAEETVAEDLEPVFVVDEAPPVENQPELEESVDDRAFDESAFDESAFDDSAFDAPVPVEETIDLVAAEATADEDPYRGPESGPDSFEPAPPGGGEPAFAGMVESSLGDAPPAEPAPPRLVTAADIDRPVAASGRLGFETSTFDASFEDDGGPVTQAVPALQDGSLFAEPETADDPFLEQLRDAMAGEPLPQGDDDALTAFFDQEDDDNGRSWFGRRR